MSTDIAPVRSRSDLAAFVALPYDLHRHDPNWTPLLRREMRQMLSRRNPFFEHAEVEHFLARRGRRPVGRITAIHNRLHNQTHLDTVGFFGFFECGHDQVLAARLLETAAGWLRGRGLTVMRGPASYSVNDDCGLLVEGFGTPSTLMMGHNPPYYADLLEAGGLRPAKDLLVYRTTSDVLPGRLVQGAALLQRRYGLTVRTLEMARFEQEVGLIKSVYNEAWERNWGFVPMTEAEIDHLAKQLRPICVPDLVVFVEHQGRTVGFGVALPDLNVALRKNRSGRLFPGILKVLWAARRITRLRVILLGTVPGWHGRGVDALIYKTIWENGRRRGFDWAEAGWILEDNAPMRNALVHMGFEEYKRYRLYDRAL